MSVTLAFWFPRDRLLVAYVFIMEEQLNRLQFLGCRFLKVLKFENCTSEQFRLCYLVSLLRKTMYTCQPEIPRTGQGQSESASSVTGRIIFMIKLNLDEERLQAEKQRTCIIPVFLHTV